MGNNNCTDLIELLHGLNELVFAKCLDGCLARSKY